MELVSFSEDVPKLFLILSVCVKRRNLLLLLYLSENLTFFEIIVFWGVTSCPSCAQNMMAAVPHKHLYLSIKLHVLWSRLGHFIVFSLHGAVLHT
jgi:hypothetical protein